MTNQEMTAQDLQLLIDALELLRKEGHPFLTWIWCTSCSSYNFSASNKEQIRIYRNYVETMYKIDTNANNILIKCGNCDSSLGIIWYSDIEKWAK